MQPDSRSNSRLHSVTDPGPAHPAQGGEAGFAAQPVWADADEYQGKLEEAEEMKPKDD